MNPKERARLADEILRNEVFALALADLEDRLVSTWKTTPRDDWRLREKLFEQLQSLKDVEMQLKDYIATAAMETTANNGR